MAKDKEGKIECLKEKKKIAVLAVKGGHFCLVHVFFHSRYVVYDALCLLISHFLSCKLNVFTRESPLLQ